MPYRKGSNVKQHTRKIRTSGGSTKTVGVKSTHRKGGQTTRPKKKK